MRKYVLLSLDLVWVALSPAIALLVRDNFNFQINILEQAFPYMALTVAAAALVFLAAGLHSRIWRYTSLGDILRVMASATIAMLIALFAAFAWNRLDGVARSLPIVQWLVMVAGLAGMRVAVRLFRGRGVRECIGAAGSSALEHVLVVGLNPITELYLRSVRTFSLGRLSVVGILAEGPQLKGRIIQFHKILGTPEKLRTVLRDQEVHGVVIGRIVITEPFETLSAEAREALLQAERARDVTLDFFGERLGLLTSVAGGAPMSNAASTQATSNGDGPTWNGGGDAPGGIVNGSGANRFMPPLSLISPVGVHVRSGLSGSGSGSASTYGVGWLKRLIDFAVAAGLILLLLPDLALLSLFVALGMGLPLTFWQSRPGRGGRPFRLYKFRTLLPAHDEAGQRLPDAERKTRLGCVLRRFRLDELPQLYNILVGEMSLVGPRPLLPIDQPPIEAAGGSAARLTMRPGLTGWAQVNGGRDMSAEDKMVLDIWYVRNATLGLDLKILLRTAVMVIYGERLNGAAVHEAWADLGLSRPITLPRIAPPPPPAFLTEPDARPARSNGPVAPTVTVADVAAEIAGREAA